MTKKEPLSDSVRLFIAAERAHKDGQDLEGVRLLIRAAWAYWPEVAYAASEQDIFEDRLGTSEAMRRALVHPWSVPMPA